MALPTRRRVLRVAGQLELALAQVPGGYLVWTLGIPGDRPAVVVKIGGYNVDASRELGFRGDGRLREGLLILTSAYFDVEQVTPDWTGRHERVRVRECLVFEEALAEVARAVLVGASIARLERFGGNAAERRAAVLELAYRDAEGDIVKVQATLLPETLAGLMEEV